MMTPEPLQYSDLFLLSVLPVVLQGAAGFYVFLIRKFIGRQMTALLGGINVALFLNNITLSYTILIAAQRPSEQPIEVAGILIAFAVPLAVASMLLLLQKRLSEVFNISS